MSITLVLFVIVLFFARTGFMWAMEKWAHSAAAQRTIIYQKPISHEQEQRENRSWPIIFASQSMGTAFYAWLGWIHFAEWNWWAIPIILVAHIVIVEPLYYAYHLLLHTSWLYKHHHVYHHLSIITEPRTSVSFTILEGLSYFFLFSIPPLVASLFGTLSLPLVFIYFIVFDFANYIGHMNFEFFPKWYKNSILKWVFYTPTFHSQHHKHFTQNYCLFMPIWDKLFNNVGKETDKIFTESLARKD